MSYDTTVHDALEPPQPRLSDVPKTSPAVRPRIPATLRRVLFATSLFAGILVLVTWLVAELTTMPTFDHGRSHGAFPERAGEQGNRSIHSE